MTPLKYMAGRVSLSRSMSRSTGWGICTGHGGLKLQGWTFLNELNRLAKELDLEDIATWPKRKPPPVTLLSRCCHAPVTLLSRCLAGAEWGLGFAHLPSSSQPAVARRPSGVLLVMDFETPNTFAWQRPERFFTNPLQNQYWSCGGLHKTMKKR